MSEEMFRQGRAPVAALRRRDPPPSEEPHAPQHPQASILSVSEIPMRVSLKSFDVVRLEG